MTTIGRTWDLWAHRYASGKFMHPGARGWVELHGIQEPIVPVLLEEILDDLYDVEITHYGWENLTHPRKAPSMVQLRANSDPTCPKRALMLLDICFAYGVQAAVDKGEGKILALRITERALPSSLFLKERAH